MRRGSATRRSPAAGRTGRHLLHLAVALAVLAAPGCLDPISPADEQRDTSPSKPDSPDTRPACEPTVSEESLDPEAPTVRIATFNVYRLFDAHCDSGDCGGDSYEEAPPAGRVDERIGEIAEALRPIDADIYVFQEIEKEALLDRIGDRLSAQERDYRARVFGEIGRAASLDVAVLADATHLETRRYRDDRPLQLSDGSESQFPREFLQATFRVGGEELILFGAHFTSQRNDDPARRLAEAKEARTIVGEALDEDPNRLATLAGDLNATPGSPALEALLDDSPLRRARPDTPGEGWSYCYRGNREAIDHILYAGECGGSYITGSLRRWGGEACPGDSGLDGSDHSAVSADFLLR